MNPSHIDATKLSREIPIEFEGPSGKIEGLWRPPMPDTTPRGVVVVAHPHPQFGGTMLNKVVFHLARVLNHDLSLASMRFNFRGIGKSEGTYDEGIGEQQDVIAAWEEARRRVPEGFLVAAGFSFGAAMTLQSASSAASKDNNLSALALAGLPFRLFDPPTPLNFPLAAIHGSEDQFTPPEKVAAYLETWAGPKQFTVEHGADHFFEGFLPDVMGSLSTFLKAQL